MACASSATIDCTAKARGMFDTERNQPMRVCAAASGFSHWMLAIWNGMIDKSHAEFEWRLHARSWRAKVETMVGATLRCRHAITLPLLSRPASIRSTETV